MLLSHRKLHDCSLEQQYKGMNNKICYINYTDANVPRLQWCKSICINDLCRKDNGNPTGFEELIEKKLVEKYTVYGAKIKRQTLDLRAVHLITLVLYL